MKWKKENNFKSLNDPNVKLEANATSHGGGSGSGSGSSNGHNHHHHPSAMSTNDASSSSWPSVPSLKKENSSHLSHQHAHPYATNGTNK